MPSTEYVKREKFMEQVANLKRDLPQLGFKLEFGDLDNIYADGIPTITIEKASYPNLLYLQLEGFKKGFIVYLKDFKELVIKKRKKRRL